MTVPEYRPDGIYVNGEFAEDWPRWERTCPRCGRYHHRFDSWGGGEGWKCTVPGCGWRGLLPETREARS